MKETGKTRVEKRKKKKATANNEVTFEPIRPRLPSCLPTCQPINFPINLANDCFSMLMSCRMVHTISIDDDVFPTELPMPVTFFNVVLMRNVATTIDDNVRPKCEGKRIFKFGTSRWVNVVIMLLLLLLATLLNVWHWYSASSMTWQHYKVLNSPIILISFGSFWDEIFVFFFLPKTKITQIDYFFSVVFLFRPRSFFTVSSNWMFRGWFLNFLCFFSVKKTEIRLRFSVLFLFCDWANSCKTVSNNSNWADALNATNERCWGSLVFGKLEWATCFD